MKGSRFVYVTYIRTTAESLWQALTQPEFSRCYWFGMDFASDWQVASPWHLRFRDGRVADNGEVLEADPPRRLVLRWRNQWSPELNAEGDARATFTLEPSGDSVKLTVLHETDAPESRLIEAVAGGWPKILSSLKTMLETGEALSL